MTRQHKTARLLRSLYMWHRWIGLAAALFVLLLSVTGLLLNHTEQLALDARYASNAMLLDWYGIRAPDRVQAFRAGDLLIAELDGQLFINSSRMNTGSSPLLGALAWHDMVVVAQLHRLLLLSASGELIESLEDLPDASDITAIGLDEQQRLLLRTAQGTYRADEELLTWTEVVAGAGRWISPSVPTDGERAALDSAWRGNGLPLERLLLDLHSGRILGQAGVWLMDTAAVVFLLLASSGLWLWGRRRASAHAHQRKLEQRGDNP